MQPTRRTMLAGLALVAIPWPGQAASEPDLAEAIARATAGAEPRDGGIVLRLPAVAENGGQVPLGVIVETPQTEADHAVAIHILCPRNPTPGGAIFRLTPALGRAEVHTRIRLAEDQQVLVLARMSDGTVRRAAAEARVVTGGCLT